MGARPLNRVISDKIKNPLTDEILFGKLKKVDFVKIDFEKEFIFNLKVCKNFYTILLIQCKNFLKKKGKKNKFFWKK